MDERLCMIDKLYDRGAQARNRNEGVFSAALAHMTHDAHPDPLGQDQWYLAIVLMTILSYFYFRQWHIVLIIFVVYYLLEYVAYYLWRMFSRKKLCSISKSHSRSLELMLDPLIFSLSLFVAWYVIDYSFIGHGIGQSQQIAIDNVVAWRAILVLLIASLSGHQSLYWQVAISLLAVMWITHFIVVAHATTDVSRSYSLWLTIRTTIVTAVLFAICFVRPFRNYFLYNALFALFGILWFTSLFHAIALHSASAASAAAV